MKQYLTPQVLAALQQLPSSDAPVPTTLATTPEELHQRAVALDDKLADLSLDQIEAQLQSIFDDDTWTQQQLPAVPEQVQHRYTYVYVNQALLGA
ncbi:aminoglycoside phosphotransferase family protein [Hymenobacter crusticola]|uniref:Uncharacterized protein n=1 Tax=Hymenobacter crusticola TaxID=1770526 RepID=A0A243W9J3_9BACT|nr:hypothetical protein [Hymenobacter crusticola]OUJ71190.1 hypothetical protein BXP70_22160 [Hymenobacter crusticola]